MRKLIVMAQISLDGFVAGVKGEFDGFIDDLEGLVFVCGQTDEADAALFGRVSYQLLYAHWLYAESLPDLPDTKRNIQHGIIAYRNMFYLIPSRPMRQVMPP